MSYYKPKYPGTTIIPSYAFGGTPGDPQAPIMTQLKSMTPQQQAAFANYIRAQQNQPNPAAPTPTDVSNATPDPGTNAALQALYGGGNATPDVETDFTTPGGNVLTSTTRGASGTGTGAGSTTLAKELQQKLTIMNLDQQNALIQLQQQQDPQLYAQQQQKFQDELAKIGIQTTAAQQNYQQGLFGINSSATASGAFASQGANMQRTGLSQQLQNQLGQLGLAKSNVGLAQQTAALNEQYNQAALQDQATMNFWERFAQAANAGFFAGGGAPAGAPKQIRNIFTGKIDTIYPGDPNY